ncbi:MAG: radical SAM family heme chaperone HemW [Candidatus Cloacimonetes bacterium]|nr:radical SAM family heme chaperone HemW [Candidatus Cloacimonadota bacterium]
MEKHKSLAPYPQPAGSGGEALSVYLHVPFCLARCPYCSFFSLPFSRSAVAEYLGYMRCEINFWQGRDPALTRAGTLYFGGGTPSLLSSGQINSLCAGFEIAPDAEITLEVNPIQITSSYLAELRKTPVNRLSIGVQSLDDADLAWLGRRHRAAQLPDKIGLCRDFGFANLSLDLIYGLPGSDSDGLLRNLDNYLALEPQHISAYLLTPDPDTPLGRALAAGKETPLPDDENLAAQYSALCSGLSASGFEHYEISNFCRRGFASRHNLTYWTNRPCLALGASASGWLPPLRYSNPADLDQYYQNVAKHKLPAGAEECSPEQARADHIMMGLRLLAGLDLNELQSLYRYDLRAAKADKIAELEAAGMLALEGSKLRLTSAALFVSNAVIGELL